MPHQPIASSTDTVAEAWVARYNSLAGGSDIVRALAVDGGGNVYVTGISQGLGTVEDYATVKYDSSGTEQWAARYNSPANSYDQAYALAVDESGNVYVTGTSWDSFTEYDFATIKYDASGVERWVIRYDGPGNSGDYAEALSVDAGGNVYVTGWSYVSGRKEQV